VVGDLNGDNLVNFGDLTPFVKALTDVPGYDAMFPDQAATRVARCDASGDGMCNFGDLTPFVMLLTGGPGLASSAAVPEPSSLPLITVMMLTMAANRRTNEH
jgi:hypothetical protein